MKCARDAAASCCQSLDTCELAGALHYQFARANPLGGVNLRRSRGPVEAIEVGEARSAFDPTISELWRPKMLAIQLSTYGDTANGLALVDVPPPGDPGAGEALIGFEYAPVNQNDLLVLAGQFPFHPQLPSYVGKRGRWNGAQGGPRRYQRQGWRPRSPAVIRHDLA